MTRTVTATAVKRVITKGLTGWEAGKLILQDMIDSYVGRDAVLTEADMAAIQQTRMEGADVRDYNMFMALCRGFHAGYMIAEWVCKDACLEIMYLDRALENARKRRTVELFESFGPHVVTRKQYEKIVAAQKAKKLEFEYSLGYVIEERFYAIATEARAEIDGLCVDIESAVDLAAAVPEKHVSSYKQAIEGICGLCRSGKLKTIYHEDNAKEAKALLARWRKGTLCEGEVRKLVDMLYITGQSLHDCHELSEWKPFIDTYQQHWFDDDERFRHAYAVLEDCPEVWLDKNGHYKGPRKPSEWITRSTELVLGLVNHHDEAGKSIKRVGAELRDRLDAVKQSTRFFLAIKAVLDTAADAVGLEVPGAEGLLASADMRLDAFVHLYNIRLEELNEESRSGQSGETRLEKALRMLPPIDVDRLMPSPDSRKQLKSRILEGARGQDWLRTKVRSLECADAIRFDELLN